VHIPSVAVPALPLIEADCADPPVSLKFDLPVEGLGFGSGSQICAMVSGIRHLGLGVGGSGLRNLGSMNGDADDKITVKG
jgi:hypothetical protein